ncbi:hypothetical protein AHX05_17370 [Salmonella enterica subsp. indica]|uniref:Uncharacterized protein n=1 Tax=Salmonella enterica TaxID=28901 RepID=A0A701ZB45_SALER|nr:hypothetical protein [Salmonella enterica subsp. indica]EBH9037239.1 hypothetical protein [Salmonella enterica subsp. indica serovar 11:b:e,n,x]ECI8270424.1 hypothetical protein [Salmonella enterica subsp. enterica]ECC3875100.1 hypothetical protein [Salmonella enterica subsp. indica]ECG1333958.1 hypothetical protein [Salmonella enterica subsp. indica]
MRLSVKQKVSAACANRNRFIINPLSNGFLLCPKTGSGRGVSNNATAIRCGKECRSGKATPPYPVL